MTRPMISPREVIEIAFGSTERVREDMIGEIRLELAQRKFLRPALGRLYEAVENGAYPELRNGYLKAPLALYIKYLIMPELAAQATAQGIVQYKNEHMAPAPATGLGAARRRVRSDAQALLARAIDHIEAHRAEYPEYDPVRDRPARTSVCGGIILPRHGKLP